MNKTEEPIEAKKEGHLKDETKITHPAFAQIAASRVSGSENLYGSEFNHQNFITISIKRSELHRTLSRDWPFPREELIEIAMSEAQWATFVSSLNNGSGVQCTISRIQGKTVPGIPAQPSKSERFAKEMNKAVSDVRDEIQKLLEELDGPLSKTKAAELRRKLEWVAGKVEDSTGFVAKQFDEHMEETTEKAKIEVNSYITSVVQRAGLDAIAGTGMLTLQGMGGKDYQEGVAGNES